MNSLLLKKLKFNPKKLITSGLTGGYKSRFRGRGIEFEEVREYIPGDDIKSIDWKVTAKSGKPYTKVFKEERELNVIVMIDISSSIFTGTKVRQLKDAAKEIAEILSFVAIQNNDQIGLVLFADKVIEFFPPKNNLNNHLKIINKIEELSQGVKSKTDVVNLFKFLSNRIKKRSLFFIISDFQFDVDFDDPILAKTIKRNDLVCFKLVDRLETNLPNVGLLKIQDPETDEELVIDTSDRKFIENFYRSYQDYSSKVRDDFRFRGANFYEIKVDQDLIYQLKRFL